MNYGDIILGMTLPGCGAGVHAAHRLVRNMLDDLETRPAGQSLHAGMPTHFTELDMALGGLRNGELIVVAGRPGMGKSIFVQSLIRNVCRKEGARVALFSLESTAETVMRGIVAGEARIDEQRIRDGNLDRDEMEKLLKASDAVARFKLWIDETPMLSLLDLRLKALHLKETHEIDLAVVDYIQLMAASNSSGRSREQEIAEITRKIKELAKILNIPIILVSQLPGKPETRHDNRPVVSDLRDSGAIEQDADVILLLHRHDSYRADERPGEVEVIIAKHRNGPTGHVRLAFIRQQHRFENLAPCYPHEK